MILDSTVDMLFKFVLAESLLHILLQNHPLTPGYN